MALFATPNLAAPPLHVSPEHAEAVNRFIEFLTWSVGWVGDPSVGFLAIGFLIGMSHALEADHLAAVGAMATAQGGETRRRRRGRLALMGAAWGLGHTITLFAICLGVIVFGVVMTDRLSATLEFAVGGLLVLLGLDVLRRLRRRRVHFHAHEHADGRRHLHAHSHAGASHPHGEDPHDHAHRTGLPLRALLVGLLHGAAGSAGLLALAAAATQDAVVALGYVLVFGAGSIVGMAALSFAASWPLGWAERGAATLYRSATVAVAAFTILIGVGVMVEAAPLVWGGV